MLARELQRHKVRGTVAHIDFQVVDPNKPVVATVPVHMIGDAVEVRHADWEIDQQLFSVELRARPADVPTHVDADISHLTPGATLHVGDLVLPAGVEAAGDKNAAVVSTRQGRVALVGSSWRFGALRTKNEEEVHRHFLLSVLPILDLNMKEHATM